MRFPVLLLLAGALLAAPPIKIHRDGFGVPHIEAKTDAGAVFGLMYAQAEDNFWQIEEDYLNALGRASEIRGPSRLLADVTIRAFEVERRAKEEYARASMDTRAIADAFAAGLNLYIDRKLGGKTRGLGRFEPWFIFAYQFNSGLGAAVSAGGFTRQEILNAFPDLLAFAPRIQAAREPSEGGEGSNMWAAGPSKSANGKALLLINPHVGYFGGGQRYEAHLMSRERLRVSGFAILGTPYIRSGFTAKHGWSHTNNYAKISDTYSEAGALSEWTEEVKYKDGDALKRVSVRIRKSARGPVVALRNGSPFTARVAGLDRGGQLEQRVAMARARSLDEFKAALSQRAITGSNTIYADHKGNIYYLHGCLIPKRAADPQADWLGYHELSELPQVLNPPGGYLQNCNSSAFLASGVAALDESKYPAYMVTERDNARAANSRRLLEAKARFSLEEWAQAAMDTLIPQAVTDVPKWLALPATPEAAPLVEELRKWDFRTANGSVATTLYLKTLPRLTRSDPMTGLAQTRRDLESQHGTWRVAYGDITRLQRIHSSGSEETFGEDKPSLPVSGGPGPAGMLFVINTRSVGKRSYAISGNTYVAVVEFGRKKTAARSQLIFGQTADAASPNFFDQAALFSERRFKPALLEWKDVKKTIRRSYAPGE